MSSQRIVLITGGTSGLGLATATQLLSLTSPRYHVIITSRTASRAASTAARLSSLPSTRGTVSSVALDVTSDASVDAAASSLAAQFGHVDVLVNNAGVYGGAAPQAPAPLREGLRAALAVNAVGAASVTEALKGLLGKGAGAARVVFVSTALASLHMAADARSAHFGPYATEYRASKAAANMLLVQFANSPAWNGVVFVGVDPGFLATDLAGDADAVRKMGAIEPEEGAKVVLRAVVGEGFESGKVTGAGEVNPW